MTDTTWKFVLVDETGGGATNTAPGAAARATQEPAGQPSQPSTPATSTPERPRPSQPQPGAASRESRDKEAVTPQPPGTTHHPQRPQPEPVAPGAASREREKTDPEPAKQPTPAQGRGGRRTDPLEPIIGPRASDFLNRFGNVFGKIPYFGRSLDLLRKIADGINVLGGDTSRGGTAAGAAQQAVGDAAEESFDEAFDRVGRKQRRKRSGRAKSAGDQDGGHPLARAAGEGAGEALGRARAAGARSGTTAAGAAAGGAATTTATGAAAGAGARAAGAAAGTATGASGAAGAAGGTAGTAAGAAGGAGAAAGAAGAAAALGPIVIPILAATAVIGAAVLATRALVAVNEKLRQHFGQLSDRLEAYSAAIQAANARIEVAQLRDDIEFARELGGRLARFNESQASIGRSFERLQRSIEGPVLNELLPFLEFAANRLEDIAGVAHSVSQLAQSVGLGRSNLSRLLEAANRIEGAIKGESSEEFPADADILGIFGSDLPQRVKDYQPLEWNGKVYGGSGQTVPGKATIERVDATPYLPPGTLP